MRKPMRAVTAAMTVALAVSLTGCGYNTFQTTDEQVKAGWAEVTALMGLHMFCSPGKAQVGRCFAGQLAKCSTASSTICRVHHRA